MMQSSGYTSLPGGWPQERRKPALTWGAYHVPVVPLACCLLVTAGLPMWAAGMMQARSTTDDIFGGLGIAAESIGKLKVAVLTSVLILIPLAAVVLGLNIWLEWSMSARPGRATTGLSLSHYASHSTSVNAANWALLMMFVLALSGSVTWWTLMDGVLSAATGGGPSPPWWPPAAAAAAPPPAAAAAPAPVNGLRSLRVGAAAVPAAAQSSAAAAVSSTAQQLAAGLEPAGRALGKQPLAAGASAVAVDGCSAGCSHPGAAAAVIGLLRGGGWQLWPLTHLKKQLQQAVRALSIAVAGALLLVVGQSLLFGYLAGQAAHAARDLEEVLKQGDGLLVVGGAAAAAAGGTGAQSQQHQLPVSA